MNGKENISDVWDLGRWLERGYVVCGMLRFISLCLCGLLSLSKFGLYLTPLDILRCVNSNNFIMVNILTDHL